MKFAELELEVLVQRASVLLARSRTRVVFAESCTAGLVAASLAVVAGISQYLCGSAVTYRDATKSGWLDIPQPILDRWTAVSEQVADLMARGVLARTPEADVAVAVTGHLGPDAPPDQDGLLLIGLALREQSPSGIISRPATRHRLAPTGRSARQREAARLVLLRLCSELESKPTLS